MLSTQINLYINKITITWVNGSAMISHQQVKLGENVINLIKKCWKKQMSSLKTKPDIKKSITSIGNENCILVKEVTKQAFLMDWIESTTYTRWLQPKIQTQKPMEKLKRNILKPETDSLILKGILNSQEF